MATSQLEVSNAALSILGATPLESLDDGSAEGDAAKAVWRTARLAVFSRANWNCLRHVIQPSEADKDDIRTVENIDISLEGWRKAYLIPATFVSLIGLANRNGGNLEINPQTRTAYDMILGKYVVVYDQGQIAMKYTRDLGPESWPRYLESVIIKQMAVNLALLLTDDDDKVQSFTKIYEMEVQEAIYLDSQAVPQRPIPDMITRIRRGGRYGGYTLTPQSTDVYRRDLPSDASD